jgi:hypothetical protein
MTSHPVTTSDCINLLIFPKPAITAEWQRSSIAKVFVPLFSELQPDQ